MMRWKKLRNGVLRCVVVPEHAITSSRHFECSCGWTGFTQREAKAHATKAVQHFVATHHPDDLRDKRSS